jgi:hypothetical protein
MGSGETVKRLRDAARALTTGDPRTRLKAIQAAQDALDAAKATELAALETSKDFELDGASTLSAWARVELRLDAGQTKKLVRAATTLRDLPAVGRAAAEGRIRLDHVAAFSYGMKHIGTRVVRESESWLLDVATTCEPAELRRVMRSLREAVYPDSLDEAWVAGMDREDLQVNPVPDGWHVNGFLNTITGSKLKTVLDSLGAPVDADDHRPGSERRVTALDVMLTQVLEAGLPSDHGVRPHLSILVGPDAKATLVGFGSVGPKLVDYLSCHADVTPIVTDGQSRILNVGRTSRLATLRQRRAVIAHQRGECAAPGCRNAHLEIHHAVWWSDGGKTDLDNLVGLCVRCHHLVHRGLLTVVGDEAGGFRFDRDHRRQDLQRRPIAAMVQARANRLVPMRT